MKNYEVSYKKNGIYQSAIVKALNKESAKKFIENYKYVDCISCSEKADISEDVRKGKPILQAPYYAYCESKEEATAIAKKK